MANGKLFNARTQQVEEATFYVDKNNEIVAQFADGSHVKFPAGLTKQELQSLIVEHEKANSGQVVITPEMEAAQAAERKQSLDLIGATEETNVVPEAPIEPATPQPTNQPANTGNTMPEGQSNVVPAGTPATPSPAA